MGRKLTRREFVGLGAVAVAGALAGQVRVFPASTGRREQLTLELAELSTRLDQERIAQLCEMAHIMKARRAGSLAKE